METQNTISLKKLIEAHAYALEYYFINGDSEVNNELKKLKNILLTVKQIRREARKLNKVRPAIQNVLDCDYADSVLLNYPEFHNSVIMLIDKLGRLTEKYGYYPEIDSAKNYTYGVIKL